MLRLPALGNITSAAAFPKVYPKWADTPPLGREYIRNHMRQDASLGAQNIYGSGVNTFLTAERGPQSARQYIEIHGRVCDGLGRWLRLGYAFNRHPVAKIQRTTPRQSSMKPTVAAMLRPTLTSDLP